jgi:hypothetical protein
VDETGGMRGRVDGTLPGDKGRGVSRHTHNTSDASSSCGRRGTGEANNGDTGRGMHKNVDARGPCSISISNK